MNLLRRKGWQTCQGLYRGGGAVEVSFALQQVGHSFPCWLLELWARGAWPPRGGPGDFELFFCMSLDDSMSIKSNLPDVDATVGNTAEAPLKLSL